MVLFQIRLSFTSLPSHLFVAFISYPPLVFFKSVFLASLSQVVLHYVAMTPQLRVFYSSLDGAGRPVDVRVGSGQVGGDSGNALITSMFLLLKVQPSIQFETWGMNLILFQH